MGTSGMAPRYRRSMLAWMDLEMTGLDPAADAIVEIATLITDDDLNVVAEGPDLVIGVAAETLAAMGDVVRRMHTKSGLLAAIEASTTTLAEAGQATLDFLRQHIPEPRSVPLCGNSIGTDRRFLATHLPDGRGLPALPIGRCFDPQGAGAAMVSRGVCGRAPEGRRPPGPG